MDPNILITTTVGVLTQTALVLKGAKSILDEYGDDVLRIGKVIFEFVKDRFNANDGTKGEIEYFAENPEQAKRQQAVAGSLANLIEQNESFRKELKKLIDEYKEAVPPEAVEETNDSVKVTVSIGGNVIRSRVITGGGDVTIGNDK